MVDQRDDPGSSVVSAGERTGLELVPEAVVVLDDAHVIAFHNARARYLLGLGDGAVGQRMTDVISLVDDAGNPCDDDLIPPGGTGTRIAERILRVELPDGRGRPVAIAGSLGDGRVILTFRSAGRRERVDAARSDLVATVSHEIRSPLTSVKGFTRTMLLKWDRFSDEQKRTMLETINEDADRVTRLLGELLDVSRIDAGRVQLHKQMVDLNGLVASVVDKALHRPEGADRELVCAPAPDLPSTYADPDKLEQILTNLVENGLKYATDSQIRVAVTLEDGGRDPDPVIHVTVSDDGPGIPVDQARRVFEKFGRGRGVRRAGTGLGLYITRGLAQAHGGDVWCVSEEGEGAVFHVTLPLVASIPG